MTAEINTADLRVHAARIQNSHPSIAARALAAADRIDAEREAVNTLAKNTTSRFATRDEAEKVASAWNAQSDRPATVFPLAGGWIVATGEVREATDEERAAVSAWLGWGR